MQLPFRVAVLAGTPRQLEPVGSGTAIHDWPVVSAGDAPLPACAKYYTHLTGRDKVLCCPPLGYAASGAEARKDLFQLFLCFAFSASLQSLCHLRSRTRSGLYG